MKKKILILIIITSIIAGLVFLNKIQAKEKTYNGTFIFITHVSAQRSPNVPTNLRARFIASRK